MKIPQESSISCWNLNPGQMQSLQADEKSVFLQFSFCFVFFSFFFGFPSNLLLGLYYWPEITSNSGCRLETTDLR